MCLHDNVRWGDVDIDDETACQEGECLECGLRFNAVYYFHYYEEKSNMDNTSPRLIDLQRSDLEGGMA